LATTCLLLQRPPSPPPFPYTTLFRSRRGCCRSCAGPQRAAQDLADVGLGQFVAEFDDLGALVAGQVVVAVAGHVFLAQRRVAARSEEHTSELQSRENLVCRLLLEKKN